MRNSTNNYGTEPLTGDVIDLIPTKRGINALLAPRSAKLILENAMLEASQNRCRFWEECDDEEGC